MPFVPMSRDFRVWTNTQTIVFTQVRTAGNRSQEVAVAKVRPLNLKELAASGGVYQGGDIRVLIPASLLSFADPEPADRITLADGTTSLTVLAADGNKRDSSGRPQTWALTTRNLILTEKLRDSITFWSPTNAQDAAGSRLPTFAQYGDAAPARVQLVTEAFQDERGKRLWIGTYDVFVLAEVSGITSEWQCRDAAGRIYEVTGTRNRMRIDELSAVQCRRTGDAGTVT